MRIAAQHRAIAFGVLYVAVFVMLAGYGYYMSQQLHIAKEKLTPVAKYEFSTDLTYYDLPRITVSTDFSSAGKSNLPPRLRADVSLEVSKKDVSLLQGYQPRITEKIGIFLSTLTPDDVSQATSISEVRSGMLKAANSVGAPFPIHDLLFRELTIM